MEMLPWLWWQPVDREKRYTYPSSKHTSYKALRGLLEFFAFSIHTSSISILLVATVYHVLTSLFVDIMDTCNHAKCRGNALNH